MLYLVFFVIINIMLYCGKANINIWNLANNIFLTGLAIIQVNWKKVSALLKFEIKKE